jgi:hypothetical protein
VFLRGAAVRARETKAVWDGVTLDEFVGVRRLERA